MAIPYISKEFGLCPKCNSQRKQKDFCNSRYSCKQCQNQYRKEDKKLRPWVYKRLQARWRTKYYQSYIKKGIKCYLSIEDVKKLWFRDKAYLLKEPSLHRLNNDGNYTFNNCSFIDRWENLRLKPKKEYCSNGHKRFNPKNGYWVKAPKFHGGKLYDKWVCRGCVKLADMRRRRKI